MSQDTIATLVAAVVIIGFLWSLHRDVSRPARTHVSA